EIEHGGVKLKVDAARGRERGERVLVLVRPESLELTAATNGGAAGENILAGEVITQTFLGPVTRLKVVGPGAGLIADVPTAGAWGGGLPAVYGHEAAGVVAEVGPAVDGVAPGDHVVVTLVRSCGRCAQCLRGLPALCESPPAHEPPLRTREGEPVHQGLRTAAFAERVTVDSSQVVPIPGDVPLEAASLLA